MLISLVFEAQESRASPYSTICENLQIGLHFGQSSFHLMAFVDSGSLYFAHSYSPLLIVSCQWLVDNLQLTPTSELEKRAVFTGRIYSFLSLNENGSQNVSSKRGVSSNVSSNVSRQNRATGRINTSVSNVSSYFVV